MDKLLIKSKLKTASKCRNICFTVSKYTLSILQNLIVNHVLAFGPVIPFQEISPYRKKKKKNQSIYKIMCHDNNSKLSDKGD